MEQIINVGIIGCGGIAQGKHLPSLARLDYVNVVAFCDIIPEKAQALAEQYGTADAQVYEDYREVLKREDIQVIHVCTPNDAHAEIAIAAMESGKHVMSEKPMAKKAADARKMLESSKATGKKLTVGYNNRHRPDSLMLKELCDRGDLGEVYHAKAHAVRRRAVPTWGVFLDGDKQGGGPLIDIGTHALDLTLWIMNNYEVHSVTGSVYHKLSQTENAANEWGPWDPEKFKVEDSAFGFITMKNGATIAIDASWALNVRNYDEAKCTLCGTKAGADMTDGLHINGEDLGKLYVKELQLGGNGVAFYSSDNDEKPEYREMRLWMEAIINDTEPLVTPEQALVVSEILEAIYTSAETGQTVYF